MVTKLWVGVIDWRCQHCAGDLRTTYTTFNDRKGKDGNKHYQQRPRRILVWSYEVTTCANHGCDRAMEVRKARLGDNYNNDLCGSMGLNPKSWPCPVPGEDRDVD